MTDKMNKKKNGLSAGNGSIVIGGNVQGSNIVMGNHNTVSNQSVNIAPLFQTIYHYVDTHPKLQAGKKQDATKPPSKEGNSDAYSVLASFKVSYGNPFMVLIGKEKPFVLDQLFATGMAARTAAKNPELQRFFGTEAGTIVNKKKIGEAQ